MRIDLSTYLPIHPFFSAFFSFDVYLSIIYLFILYPPLICISLSDLTYPSLTVYLSIISPSELSSKSTHAKIVQRYSLNFHTFLVVGVTARSGRKNVPTRTESYKRGLRQESKLSDRINLQKIWKKSPIQKL